MRRAKGKGMKRVVAALGGLIASSAVAQVPDGYEVVVLANDLGIHSRPDINNRGDVVWSSSFPIDESDVWLFSDGIIQKISEPESYDVNPAINNNGVVAWRRCESFFAEACELVTWQDGEITHIPAPVTIDRTLDINDAGDIVFEHDFLETANHVELFLYDGETVEQITDNGFSNQVPRMNSEGDIAWVKFDFSVSPWQSHIMLRSNESTAQLTKEKGMRSPVDINDSDQVIWFDDEIGIVLWEGGDSSVVTNDGANPRINDAGDVIFMRWNEATSKWDTWCYFGGEFFRTSDGVGSSAGGTIGNTGDACWREFINDFGDTGIKMFRRIPPDGDLDGDCDVDFGDFRALQGCFTGDQGPPGRELLGNCTPGDFDSDGDVDRDDFAAFVFAYTGPEEFVKDCEP